MSSFQQCRSYVKKISNLLGVLLDCKSFIGLLRKLNNILPKQLQWQFLMLLSNSTLAMVPCKGRLLLVPFTISSNQFSTEHVQPELEQLGVLQGASAIKNFCLFQTLAQKILFPLLNIKESNPQYLSQLDPLGRHILTYPFLT